jgi:hypothetical protein
VCFSRGSDRALEAAFVVKVSIGVEKGTPLDHRERFIPGVHRGDPPGFQTPSRVCGADYILSFDGMTRNDLNS